MASNQPEPTERPEFDYKGESAVEKMKRKTQDNPFMSVGLIGTAIVASYGIYKFKHRGNLSASNYLMQLRVTAQGVVIGVLTVGVIKSIYDRLTKKPDESSS